MLTLHGTPWLKDHLKEHGFTNEDGTLKLEMAQKLPWKGEPADPDSPKLVGDQKLRAQNLKGCAVSWAMIKWRPDCQPGVLGPCGHMANPTEQSLAWILQVWRCMLGTLEWVLAASKDDQTSITRINGTRNNMRNNMVNDRR